MNNLSTRGQRGIALFAVLFAILLLSVIGLGMMYSTNTETAINSNYKEAQIALYAATAGLQEARDRIQPATANIVAPTALPSLSAANVIYIINPRAGETIAPWDTTNRFFDTELCQEGVLGLSGPRGVPCTTIASGTSWYSVVNNSLSASAPWNLATPTDMKWTRITVKGNNMTPVPVNGDSTSSAEVCWDGHNQIAIPPGYGSNCRPNGSIASITLTAQGTGYNGLGPTVTISAPPTGGTQATADATVAVVNTDQISSVTVDNPGAGYDVPPIVTITGTGTGAVATAVISPPHSPVASVSLTSPGTQCYAAVPGVTIAGGGGSGAAATATLEASPSCIVTWNPSAHCTSNPPRNSTITNVNLNGGGGGSGFVGTITFGPSGHVSSSSIQNAGTGFVNNSVTVTHASLGACVVTANAVVGRLVNSISLTAPGGGFTTTPTVTIGSGTGTAATAPTGTATLGPVAINGGQVTAINVTIPGSGYTAGTTVVTLTGTATTGAAATANLSTDHVISAITITNPGSGYLADPTVTINGAGSGGTATARLGRGPNYGMVYLLTSFAQTRSGARSLTQMEVVTPVMGYATTGALTLDGPDPILGAFPNSNPFFISGVDANTCGETPEPDHPAIDGYDDPNADPPTHSVQSIIAALPRPDHYVGAGGIPSVQNGYEPVGETMGSPTGLKALIDAVRSKQGANVYPNNPSSIALGTATNPVFNYVEGNLTLNGSPNGYGVLVVTGTLEMGGDFHWYGPVLVIGDGIASFDGGGTAQITGTVIVAKIWDNFTNKNLLSALGSPSFEWNGGGGNGIYYDHCWSDNLMSQIPFDPPPTAKPLRILSTRTLP